MSGMGAANVGPEFTMNEYDALAELEQEEIKHFEAGSIPQLSHITRVLWQQVYESGRWKKWLHGDEVGKDLSEVSPERQLWLVKTGCYFAIDHSDLKLSLVTVTVFFRGCNSWANIVITVAVWLKFFETIDDYLPFKL